MNQDRCTHSQCAEDEHWLPAYAVDAGHPDHAKKEAESAINEIELESVVGGKAKFLVDRSSVILDTVDTGELCKCLEGGTEDDSLPPGWACRNLFPCWLRVVLLCLKLLDDFVEFLLDVFWSVATGVQTKKGTPGLLESSFGNLKHDFHPSGTSFYRQSIVKTYQPAWRLWQEETDEHQYKRRNRLNSQRTSPMEMASKR